MTADTLHYARSPTHALFFGYFDEEQSFLINGARLSKVQQTWLCKALLASSRDNVQMGFIAPLVAQHDDGDIMMPLLATMYLDNDEEFAVCASTYIHIALSFGNYQLAEMMLKLPRADPSSEDSLFLQDACKLLSPKALRLVLRDDRVDPNTDDHKSFRYCCKRSDPTMLKLLLADRRTSIPKDKINQLVCYALGLQKYRNARVLIAYLAAKFPEDEEEDSQGDTTEDESDESDESEMWQE